MSFIITPNMSLPIPTVGSEPGPQYATDVNNSLNLIDSHNHTPGYGVAIPVSGLNINGDLPLNNNSIVQAASVVFNAQLSLGTLQAVYVQGVDLFYNDGNGNAIQLTVNGSIAGTTGNITGLTSPASASYNSDTFTFESNAGTSVPANIDAGSYVVRKEVASSAGITLSAPTALSADYTLTLPASASNGLLSLDASGNIISTDPSTTYISYNTTTKLLSLLFNNITDNFTFNNASGAASSITINNDNIDAIALSDSAAANGIGLSGAKVNGYNTLRLDGQQIQFNTNSAHPSELFVDPSIKALAFQRDLAGAGGFNVALESMSVNNTITWGGVVSAAGGVVSGTNISVSHTSGSGTYAVSLSNTSSTPIAIVVSPVGAGILFANVVSTGSGSFTVTTASFGGGVSDQGFSFLFVAST